MTKNEMKDLLFDTLNEHDTLFSDITLNDTLNSLIVTSIDKERFIITIDNLKEP